MNTLDIIRGDTRPISVHFSDKSTTPATDIDITDCAVFFTVKRRNDVDGTDDSAAVISKKITSHTDPTHGLTEIVLTKDDTDLPTGEYLWDLQIVNLSGVVTSTRAGLFNVNVDITRRTA